MYDISELFRRAAAAPAAPRPSFSTSSDPVAAGWRPLCRRTSGTQMNTDTAVNAIPPSTPNKTARFSESFLEDGDCHARAWMERVAGKDHAEGDGSTCD